MARRRRDDEGTQTRAGAIVTFEEILTQAMAMLQCLGRVSYRALKVQFQLDDDLLEILKDEIVTVHQLARDQEGKMLVWTGDTTTAAPRPQPTPDQAHAPLTYTPPHLAEKILTSRSALEGERKQVTVLFADLKGSMELLADRDPEEARQLLDPVLERMMEAVHRYEGTVNQVMGDGIMALFGAPLAHEDHAVRACYAALAMQVAVKQYATEVQRTHGVPVQIRVGLHAGEVVVRAIGSDLHMDYTAVGQTTHLAARMEQMAMPGSILLTQAVLHLAEGYVQATPLGPMPVKGVAAPIEVFELVGASGIRRRLQATVARGLTRFVGRDTEFAALTQALERAGSRQGQVVAVVGEAGVGKSRLVYECIHSHHTQGWQVLESTSVEPLAEALGDPQRLCLVSYHLCWAFLAMEDHARAIAAGQCALALATASGAVDLHIMIQSRLGIVYYAAGDVRKALHVSRWVMAALEGQSVPARFGQLSPSSVTSRVIVARCLADMGMFAEGMVVAEEAVHMAEAVAQPYSIAIALHSVGFLSRCQGDLSHAIPVLQRSLALCQDANIARWVPLIASPGALPPWPRHTVCAARPVAAGPHRAVCRHDNVPEHGHDLLAPPHGGDAGTGGGTMTLESHPASRGWRITACARMRLYQGQNLVDEDRLKLLGLLKGWVMRRVLEPYEPFARRVDRGEVLPGQECRHLPVIAPEQEEKRHVERSVRRQVELRELAPQVLQREAIALAELYQVHQARLIGHERCPDQLAR
jgi:class 3 adenylate cyclase